jgi:hypothetical protein
VQTTATRRRRASLTAGGTDGNERLTSTTGAVLIVLLAVLGLTIIRNKQLIWLHLFLGLALLGPVVLKLASTGYRFVRYYMNDPAYRAKGPPEALMRTTAPLVVVSTVVVFVTGILLLIDGPRSRSQFGEIHKVSFIVWLVFIGVHILGHLPGMAGSLRTASADGELTLSSPGSAGRWITLAGALVVGFVLASVLIPQFGGWTASGAFPHHHHG